MRHPLFDILTLTRPLVGLDCETTGERAEDARICELGFEIFKPDGSYKRWQSRINPQHPIMPAATEKHGLTNADVENSPVFAQLARNIAMGMSDCDFIGFYLKYDLRVMQEEMKRANVEWTYDGANIIDGHRLWQIAKPRTLQDAVEAWLGPITDEELSGMGWTTQDARPHTVEWDVAASSRVVAAILQNTVTLPRDLRALMQLQWPDMVDLEGKLKRRADGAIYFTFGKHRDETLQQVPAGYLRWILENDFSSTVKAACDMALAEKEGRLVL